MGRNVLPVVPQATDSSELVLRVAAVDDEPLARDYLRSLLEKRPDVDLIAIVESGSEAIDLLESEEIDLFFLDIRMPDIDGLDVSARAAEMGVLVIFTTAYDVHAIEAFDMEAVDYLLKPFDEERLDRALERAVERNKVLTRPALDTLIDRIEKNGDPNWLKKFVVKHKERMLILDPSEVNWIEAYGNYVKLHTKDARYHLRATMKSLEKALDPDVFIRIHRSSMVRLDAVRELHKASHGDMSVTLTTGEELTLSRHYRDRIESLMGAL